MPVTVEEIAQANITKIRRMANPLLAHMLELEVQAVETLPGSLLQDLLLNPRAFQNLARQYLVALHRIAGAHYFNQPIQVSLQQRITTCLSTVVDASLSPSIYERNLTIENSKAVLMAFTAATTLGAAPYAPRLNSLTAMALESVDADNVKPIYEILHTAYTDKVKLGGSFKYFTEEYFIVLAALLIIATAETPIQVTRKKLTKAGESHLEKFITVYLELLKISSELTPAEPKHD